MGSCELLCKVCNPTLPTTDLNHADGSASSADRHFPFARGRFAF
jgi:hypothetical protein